MKRLIASNYIFVKSSNLLLKTLFMTGGWLLNTADIFFLIFKHRVKQTFFMQKKHYN